MYFCPLASGSSGNALFVQAGDARVLVDAGLSGRAIERALSGIGVAPTSLSAILISHEHSDHIRGAGVLSKRSGIPVYATEKTWLAMEEKPGISAIALKDRRVLCADQDFYIRDLAVSPFSIPHDAADPVGFSLYHGGRKLSIATDLGHLSPSWQKAISEANLVLLEANHDPELLQGSARYPFWLKARIAGKRGHLSNEDCGSALRQLVREGLRHAILGHLSAETNTPEMAMRAALSALQAEGVRPDDDIRIEIAPRDLAGNLYTI